MGRASVASASVWRAVVFALLVALPLMFVLVADALVPEPNDDAFIFLRYADNVASGHGAVFNPGERVEGFSSPLWLAVLTAARCASSRWDVDAMAVAQWLSTACVLAAYAGMLALLRAMGARSGAMLVGAVGFLLSPIVFVWGRSGMDAMLASALLVWTLVALDRARGEVSGRRTVTAALLMALLVTARPEGAVWAGAAMAASALADRRAEPLATARVLCGVVVAVAIALELGRVGYFHALVPNTASAKMSAGASFWRRGLEYVGDFLAHAAPLSVPLGAFAAWGQRRALERATLVLFGVVLVIVVAESGDFLWFWRFCAPTWPLAVALTAIGVDRMWSRGRAGKVVAGACASAFLILQARASMDGDLAMRAEGIREDARSQTALGKTLRGLFLAGDSVVVGPLGRVVYYSRPTRAWDVWGLVVPEIAKSPRTPGKVGHERHVGALLEARRPTFVMWDLHWQHGVPCDHVDVEGHARALEPDFAMFDAHPDYVVGFVTHPNKRSYASFLVRVDALAAPRDPPIRLARDACRRTDAAEEHR